MTKCLDYHQFLCMKHYFIFKRYQTFCLTNIFKSEGER